MIWMPLQKSGGTVEYGLMGGHDVTVRGNTFRNNLGPGIQISAEDHQQPYGYVFENNTSTENYYGIYVWNFGTSDFPSESILRMSNNQIPVNNQPEGERYSILLKDDEGTDVLKHTVETCRDVKEVEK